VDITMEKLHELQQFDSPIISDAIELFAFRSQIEGFMSTEIKSIFPGQKPVVGYDCNSKITASKPPTEKQKSLNYDYYNYVKNARKPTFVVIEDLDPRPVGSFWGEVNASVHKSLGCVGVITNGGVRDLDQVKELNFAYFASCVLVSHGYAHLVDFNCEVEVGGMKVKPGDLFHADKHGVVLIPEEITPQVAEACRKIQYAEEVLIKNCQQRFGAGVKVDELKGWREETIRRKTQFRE